MDGIAGKKEKLIVALDVDNVDQALEIVDQLGEEAIYYKVGMQLYNFVGPELVKLLSERGKKVFVDLKFHDIPNTVAQAGRVMTRIGASMFNVHIAGGYKMMAETVEQCRDEAKILSVNPPIIIGVTVLTSINQEHFNQDLGFSGEIADKVREWALLAKKAGLDGVVASAQEAEIIKEACGNDFLIVTPGIRPSWAAVDDQQRITTPAKALVAGATHIVVGRPITKQEDMKAAAKDIITEMEEV